MTAGFWDGAPVIHAYTRTEALRDGVLIDAGAIAQEAGFKVPVALTAGAWADAVAWTDRTEERKAGTGQSEAGRLWDVMVLAHRAAKNNPGKSTVLFDLYRVPREGKGIRARQTWLVLTVGPGDNLEPVATIHLPNED